MEEFDANAPKEPIDVYAFITMLLDQTAAIAWQKMGLQPDWQTGKIERDLDQARVAIDLTAHMAGALEAKLDDEDRRRLQAIVRDLRLNYVQKTQDATS